MASKHTSLTAMTNLDDLGVNEAEPGRPRASAIDLDLMALDAGDVVQLDLKTGTV